MMEELTSNLKRLINKSMVSLIESERTPTPDEVLKISQYERINRLSNNKEING